AHLPHDLQGLLQHLALLADPAQAPIDPAEVAQTSPLLEAVPALAEDRPRLVDELAAGLVVEAHPLQDAQPHQRHPFEELALLAPRDGDRLLELESRPLELPLREEDPAAEIDD